MVNPVEPFFKIPDLAHLEKNVDDLIADRKAGRLKTRTAKKFVHLTARVKGANQWHKKLEEAEELLKKKRSELKPGQYEKSRIHRELYRKKLVDGYYEVANQLVDPVVRAYLATHGNVTHADDRTALVQNVQRIYHAFGHMVENHFNGVPQFAKAWRDDREVPYIVHTATVAKYMAERGASADHIISALHHDGVEDTSLTIQDIKNRYDRYARRNFSISRTVSLLSKPIVRMRSNGEATIPPGSTDQLRILMPESDEYNLSETNQDNRLRKKHRSFLNRMQLGRLLPEEEAIDVGKKAFEQGRLSEEWVALNIKLADVLANLQTFEGKVKKEVADASQNKKLDAKTQTRIRKDAIEKMVRERREFIDLYKKVCPAMWDSLPAEIRTAYLGLADRENLETPVPSVASLISPGYRSSFVVSPARAGLTSANFPDVPDASGFAPNIHYVMKGNKISTTHLEVLFPELLIYGRKPAFDKNVLKTNLQNELMQHVKLAFPKLDYARLTAIVQPVRSLLYPNDPHRFIGFRIHLNLLPRAVRHEVFDSIVKHTAAAMAYRPITSLERGLHDLLLGRFKNGSRWQAAPHINSNSYTLALPKPIFGYDPGMLYYILERWKRTGLIDSIRAFPLPNATFHRFNVDLTPKAIETEKSRIRSHTGLDPKVLQEMAVKRLLEKLSTELKTVSRDIPEVMDAGRYREKTPPSIPLGL